MDAAEYRHSAVCTGFGNPATRMNTFRLDSHFVRRLELHSFEGESEYCVRASAAERAVPVANYFERAEFRHHFPRL